MDLWLLRHGIPVEPGLWSGAEIGRPLTPEGTQQTQQVIAQLKKTGRLTPTDIWCSPYTRCQQTAQIAGQELGLKPQISRALASGLALSRSLPQIHGDPAGWPSQLLCVGHAPDLGDLISFLVGARPGSYALGRAGSARLSGHFGAGRMKLEWLLDAHDASKVK